MNSKELAELIRQNTRIILPEFGAFLVKDNGEKGFNPNNVSFSPFLRYNDGMLEVFVAKSRGISKDEATKDVRDFVETIKNELLEKGVFPIEGLGLLKRDQRGGLSFTLSLTSDIKVQSEVSTSEKLVSKKEKQNENVEPMETFDNKKEVGLEKDSPIADNEVSEIKSPKTTVSKAKVEKLTVSKKTTKSSKIADDIEPIPIPEITREATVETKIELEKEITPSTKPLIEEETKLTEKIIEINEVKDKKVETEKTISTNEPIIEKKKRMGLKRFIYTGIAIAVIILMFFLIKNYYLAPDVEPVNDNLSTIKAPEKDITKIDAKEKIEKPKDDIDKVFNKIESDKQVKQVKTKEQIKKEEAQEEAIKNTVIKNSQNNAITGGKYHIVAGSFKSHKLAEKYLNELKKSGYKPTIVIQPSGMNAVTIGTYSTRNEAEKEMKKFKEKLSNLWILKK
ncbi:MAG: SPOR domain-containing protein [Bacteroidales bacterium]|nr:SPOR domain-containing protein [Bacteroidales bacterium]